MSTRAIFLDRDGVINENRGDHVTSWAQFRFIPEALTAVRLLAGAGFRIFVVTNQAVINRGLASRIMIEAIHQRMLEAIRAAGGEIVAVRYCPHMPEEGCLCRKPAPGMLRDLASEWQIDMAQAYMVGDALSDIAAGQAVGSTTVLVRSGRGAAQIALLGQAGPRPDYIAADLRDAADWITARGA